MKKLTYVFLGLLTLLILASFIKTFTKENVQEVSGPFMVRDVNLGGELGWCDLTDVEYPSQVTKVDCIECKKYMGGSVHTIYLAKGRKRLDSFAKNAEIKELPESLRKSVSKIFVAIVNAREKVKSLEKQGKL